MTGLLGCWLIATTPAVALDDELIHSALAEGHSVDDLITDLLDSGHSPQRIAETIILFQPSHAPRVAAMMASREPQEAPFIVVAIARMVGDEITPIASAVIAAVPHRAAAIARHAAQTFPDQAASIVQTALQPIVERAVAVQALAAVLEVTADKPESAFLAPDRGWVINVTGPAFMTGSEGTYILVSGDSVPAGATLTTGMAGRLVVIFPDLSALALFPSSRLTLAASDQLPWEGRLDNGILRFIGGNTVTPPTTHLQLGDNLLILEVADIVAASGDRSGVIVLDGQLTTMTRQQLGPGSYLLDAQQPTRIQPDGIHDWLSQLGLHERDIGDLAGNLPWFVAQLRPPTVPPTTTASQTP